MNTTSTSSCPHEGTVRIQAADKRRFDPTAGDSMMDFYYDRNSQVATFSVGSESVAVKLPFQQAYDLFKLILKVE